MSHSNNIKQAIKQSGLYLPGGPPFSSVEATTQILAAFTGTEGQDQGLTLQQRFYNLAPALFTVLVTYQHLFLSLGVDNGLTWEIMTGAWTTYAIISPAFVKEAVQVIIQARRNYNPNNGKGKASNTPLTRIVDQWIIFIDQLKTLPRPTQISLPARPLFAGSGHEFGFVNALQHLSLTNTAPDVPWPPSHFTADDFAFLANFRVSDALHGVADTYQGTDFDLPTRLSSPWAMRIFLCWVGLTGITANTHKALYMTPIGYKDQAERRQWYSTPVLTFGRGKTTVVGQTVKWFCHPHQVKPLHNILDMRGEDNFTRYPVLARYGTTIVLRLIYSQGSAAPRLQMIWFDPHVKYQQVQKEFGAHKHALMDYRGVVQRNIIEWAKASNFSGMEIWWGGRQSRVEGTPDSVELSSAFAQQWVQGPDLPEDADRLQILGFQKMV